MGGEEKSLEEIMEMIIPIAIFLTVASAIVFFSNPNHLLAVVASKEVSYISSQISGTGIEVELNYEDLSEAQIDSENYINIKIEDLKSPAKSKYYGGDVDLTHDSSSILITS